MSMQLQITFRNIESSPAIIADIEKRSASLERVHPQILACHVAVEAPHRHHKHGNLYRIRIDITVPGAELVVGREGPQDRAHADVYIALRDAFRAARRQLLDHQQVVRGEVKEHTSAA